MVRTRILIAGIGGVGGYFGGMLAKHYENSDSVEIIFLARGENYKKIKANGLKVIKGDTEFIAKPSLVTNDATEIGIVDVVVICTKTYHLQDILQQLKPCVGEKTLILPLLNGVDAEHHIEVVYRQNRILGGCVYIVARLKEPGVVENSGNIEKLHFGTNGDRTEQTHTLETIILNAGIDAHYASNIERVVWEKFIFISPTATATSYFNACTGQIVDSADKLKAFTDLVAELVTLAKRMHMLLDADIIEKTTEKIKKLPYATTSSMHSDLKNGNSLTELEALTGYVVEKGKIYDVPTPTYDLMYKKLKGRI